MNADVHALAGAYALDALPADEAAAFAEHMDECSACQQEVAELQVTAAQLGLTVTQEPPPALRDRVLTAVHQTRQIPPLTPPTDLSARRRRMPRLVAAAAIAVVLAGGGLAVGALLEDASDPQVQNPIAAVMQDPNAHTASSGLRGGGKLTVVRSQRLDAAVVLGEDLPRLDPDRVYQLWLLDDQGNARSAGVLMHGSQPSTGQTSLVRGLRPGEGIAITREPAGGSEQPSMMPLGVVDRI